MQRCQVSFLSMHGVQVKELLLPFGSLKAFNLVMDKNTGNSKVNSQKLMSSAVSDSEASDVDLHASGCSFCRAVARKASCIMTCLHTITCLHKLCILFGRECGET